VRFGPFRPEVLAAISQNPAVARQVKAVAAQVQDRARQLAPKETGKGARGIYVKRHFDQQTREVSYRVGFRPSRFYMRFIEQGWKHTGGQHIPGKHFLGRAADEINRR
jgi:HK97 gp10 family phage protein